jgi:hypothetical protein
MVTILLTGSVRNLYARASGLELLNIKGVQKGRSLVAGDDFWAAAGKWTVVLALSSARL